MSFMLARFNLSFKGDGQVWHREREGTPGQAAALSEASSLTSQGLLSGAEGAGWRQACLCVLRSAVKAWRSA